LRNFDSSQLDMPSAADIQDDVYIRKAIHYADALRLSHCAGALRFSGWLSVKSKPGLFVQKQA
jgi:hypothetical protein